VTRRIRVDPDAEAELAAASLWYESRCAGLGADLVAAVDEAFEGIVDAPLAHAVWRTDPTFRRCLVRRFPYFIFYTVAADDVHVVAVAHAKRRPGYWRRRE
jgi:plasmid stabilization system protein ParE